MALTIAGKTFEALLDTGASASLFGDEVLTHLRQNSVRLRECNTAFRLASGIAHSSGTVRLVARWENRVRRQRFVHLPSLSVPIILGRDFLAKTGIVIDVSGGGYREGTFAPLKPFCKPPTPAKALVNGAGSSSRDEATDSQKPGTIPSAGFSTRLQKSAEASEKSHPLLTKSCSVSGQE